MAPIQRFQDIEAWQQARELTRAVYRCSGSGSFARDFALRDQIRRAAVSIVSNTAEGFERGGSAEFAQCPAIARGSTGELEAQLYIALDQGYLTEKQFAHLQDLASSTRKPLTGFMKYLKTTNLRGHKYKLPPQT